MAAARKSTGTSRPRTTGAAPAVEPKTTEAEKVIEVETPTTDPTGERTGDNTEAHDASDAPANDITADPEAPAEDLDGADTPAEDTDGADDDQAPPPRDLAVLTKLADTSGRTAVTPYPGHEAPTPTRTLPPLRDTHTWTRDGDTATTARVLIDGWRTRINGIPRFAGKGDRVTAPTDVIEAAIKRGTLAPDPQE